jgi:hypothetical protein
MARRLDPPQRRFRAGRDPVAEDAAWALAHLVRTEYPEGYTLTEIAETWGLNEGLTPEEVEAIRAFEAAR